MSAQELRAARELVRRLRAKVRALEGTVRDFADYGLRADLTPTMVPGGNYRKGEEGAFYQTYLRECDASVRQRARQGLRAAGSARRAARKG